MVSKPYQAIPIVDCGEPLVAIPLDEFAWVDPHPYAVLGAPYGDRSPFFVRQGILDRLRQAQTQLQQQQPGWQIQIFDAYRPVSVQQFMVDYTFEQERQAQGLGTDLTPEQTSQLWEQVHQFWAVPSSNPATPPPHSTGAAVDVTLVDASGQVVDMGSPIDEISERSYPNHFAELVESSRSPQTKQQAQPFAHHRALLRNAMVSAGFVQHPNEWWHFSYGDQIWGWLRNEDGAIAQTSHQACYGAAE